MTLMEELRERELKRLNKFKAFKYATAIRSIASHPVPIKSGEEAKVLPGIGKSIAATIQEIIDTVPSSTTRLIIGNIKKVRR